MGRCPDSWPRRSSQTSGRASLPSAHSRRPPLSCWWMRTMFPESFRPSATVTRSRCCPPSLPLSPTQTIRGESVKPRCSVLTTGRLDIDHIAALEALQGPVTIDRRCEVLTELLATARHTQADAALLIGQPEIITGSFVEQLRGCGLRVVVITDLLAERERLRLLGVRSLPDDVPAETLAQALQVEGRTQAEHTSGGGSAQRCTGRGRRLGTVLSVWRPDAQTAPASSFPRIPGDSEGHRCGAPRHHCGVGPARGPGPHDDGHQHRVRTRDRRSSGSAGGR